MMPVQEGATAGAQTSPPANAMAPTPNSDEVYSQDLLNCVLESLDGSKAEEIVSIDLSGKSAIGDHIVVASGRSHRHVGAIADHLLRELKTAGYGTAKVEGLPHCDWVLVDTGDVLVHIFRPEVRTFYAIEKMWSDSAPSSGTRQR